MHMKLCTYMYMYMYRLAVAVVFYSLIELIFVNGK